MNKMFFPDSMLSNCRLSFISFWHGRSILPSFNNFQKQKAPPPKEAGLEWLVGEVAFVGHLPGRCCLWISSLELDFADVQFGQNVLVICDQNFQLASIDGRVNGIR